MGGGAKSGLKRAGRGPALPASPLALARHLAHGASLHVSLHVCVQVCAYLLTSGHLAGHLGRWRARASKRRTSGVIYMRDTIRRAAPASLECNSAPGRQVARPINDFGPRPGAH